MTKQITLLLMITAVILQSCGHKSENSQSQSGELKGTISISGAFALYPLAVKWGEEFTKLHPEVNFDTQGGGAGKGMTDVLSGTVNIAMCSREINDEEVKKDAFGIAVTKDAVLPTISAENPALNDLLAKGATQDELTKIWITGEIKTWGQLTGGTSKDAINVYTRSDAGGAADTWAKYLGNKKQEDLKGTGVNGDPGVADAVSKDAQGIGYNNIGYVYDATTKKPNDGIRPLPIDVNGNGQIDPEENFYGTVDDLDNAILKGAYPSPPARQLYFVTKGKPTDPLVIAFLNWVLNDGQKFVGDAGYVKLSDDVLKEQVNKLGIQ